MVFDGFGLFRMVSGGFGWFAVLVVTFVGVFFKLHSFFYFIVFSGDIVYRKRVSNCSCIAYSFP